MSKLLENFGRGPEENAYIATTSFLNLAVQQKGLFLAFYEVLEYDRIGNFPNNYSETMIEEIHYGIFKGVEDMKDKNPGIDKMLTQMKFVCKMELAYAKMLELEEEERKEKENSI